MLQPISYRRDISKLFVQDELPLFSNSQNGTLTKQKKMYQSAVITTCLSVIAACSFGIFIIMFYGQTYGFEFFAGYIVEQSLSIDNLFVFIMLFDYFKVPLKYQSGVLFWGIFGAVLMRGVMIFIG